jgi:colicin import membrane protein
MKKHPTVFKIALGLLALALMSTVSPAKANEATPKKEKGPSKAELKKYDANGDGQLDEAETAKMKADEKAKREEKRAEDLAKYDENKDSKLNKSEREKMKADKEAAKAEKKAEKEAAKEAKEAEKK